MSRGGEDGDPRLILTGVNEYDKDGDECQGGVDVVRRLIEVELVSTSGACGAPAFEALSEAEAREVAHVFHALCDPVRLRIFSLIASGGEVCSCNLEAPVAKSQPTVSHHTRILASAGLIVGERRGRWTYWRVVPERLRHVTALLGT